MTPHRAYVYVFGILADVRRLGPRFGFAFKPTIENLLEMSTDARTTSSETTRASRLRLLFGLLKNKNALALSFITIWQLPSTLIYVYILDTHLLPSFRNRLLSVKKQQLPSQRYYITAIQIHLLYKYDSRITK